MAFIALLRDYSLAPQGSLSCLGGFHCYCADPSCDAGDPHRNPAVISTDDVGIRRMPNLQYPRMCSWGAVERVLEGYLL